MNIVFDDWFRARRSYRPSEVATGLGVHVDTVRRWIRTDQLDCIWIGKQRRVSHAALLRFVERSNDTNK